MSPRTILALCAAALLLASHPAAAQPTGQPKLSLAPTNAAAVGSAVKLRVSRAGIQQVSAASLAAAGLDLAAVDASRLWLRRAGQPVAIELRPDGLWFYAPTPGDRWNAADTYWLTLEGAPGPRIASVGAGSGGATSTTALERGAARGGARYDSLTAGPDGDHWFLADLRAGPGLPPASVTVPLTETLPLAGGSLTLRISGSAYVGGAHQLRVSGGAAESTASWSGDGDFAQTVTLAASPSSVTLTLLASVPDAVLIDRVEWERTVTLDATGRGAAFVAPAGTFRYQISGAAADATLYDVSDPAAPVRVTLASGAFTATAGAAGRPFVLGGAGTQFAPVASAHTPANLAAPLDADALYIGPASLHAALAPLVAQRAAQGYTPAVLDVQAIYDAWSYGQVSPEAIRTFLRYAAATWSRRPAGVTLVGDGTSDPLDYTRRGAGNVNLVPPYLAMVDPWIGETACEGCYAHLDGDDPRLDPTADILLGRLPAKSPAELSGVVAKIVAYEQLPSDQEWLRRRVFVADNYREVGGAADGAGDFAAVADEVAASLTPGDTVLRVYYDPTAPAGATSGRISEPAAARQATFNALDDGAGVVTYIGHGSVFQWAETTLNGNLLGQNDPPALANGGRLPMVLSMTCLTGAFQTPLFSGAVLDERMLLNPSGGAVAVWGPTGFGVLHGHDALMRGFFRAMTAGGGGVPGLRDARAVGALVRAGYLEATATAPCCDDAVLTFALLGDPLTPLKAAERRILLPVTRR